MEVKLIIRINVFLYLSTITASQEIPRISQNPKVHYRIHKRPPPVLASSRFKFIISQNVRYLRIYTGVSLKSYPRAPQMLKCFAAWLKRVVSSFLGTAVPCLVRHNVNSASYVIVYKFRLHLVYMHHANTYIYIYIYIYSSRTLMGSNPSQTTPQHARKGNIMHFFRFTVLGGQIFVCAVVCATLRGIEPSDALGLHLFSPPALTFMAFLRENRSFGSLV